MFFRWLALKLKRMWKNIAPQTLFGRSLLILITPVFLTVSIGLFVFFDRHWSTTTSRMAYAIAGEISLINDTWAKADSPDEKLQLIRSANQKLGFILLSRENQKIPKTKSLNVPGIGDVLRDALKDKLGQPFSISPYTDGNDNDWILVNIQTPNGVLEIDVPQKRLFSVTTYVFLLFMIGSGLLLVLIAVVFMRNQIRPIKNLAYAAEQFGKGIDSPSFKASGAREVRQAALSFLEMRDRLKRQIKQRTEMLAGVSHDLRTPLTRLKLQLAMLPPSNDVDLMHEDITAMERMIASYLDFAKGESLESPLLCNLNDLLQQSITDAQRQGQDVTAELPENPVVVAVRPHAMLRVFGNILDNARLYAQASWVTLNKLSRNAEIIFDDAGPGIPVHLREDVFKPFHRLDSSRNQDIEGTGLGLTIARDIVQSHGGTLKLDTSPQGGLRLIITLPL